MRYSFPQITHINDVLPAIEGRDEFIVVQKDGYQIVNYAVMMEDSFPPVELDYCDLDQLLPGAGQVPVYPNGDAYNAALRRECRGLVFDLEGNLISRRFHKFFNVNERDETRFEKVDFTKPHVVLEKLDGSMVSPCYVKGHIRWMTKMGITDTSMEAEAFVATHPVYTEFADTMLKQGCTPIFEWCSNKNRIVLAYPEDKLVLTAIRDNVTGKYVPHELDARNGWGIPVVQSFAYDSANILDVVREQEGIEGVVIRFADGHMLKVKADWYVLRHKSKDAITREKNVLDYIVNERVDDVLPFLQAEDQHRLLQFQDKFWTGVNKMVDLYEEYIAHNLRHVDRKQWAMGDFVEMRKQDQHVGTIVFGWYDGRDVKETLLNVIRKNIGTQARINENRYLWGGTGWHYSFDGDA